MGYWKYFTHCNKDERKYTPTVVDVAVILAAVLFATVQSLAEVFQQGLKQETEHFGWGQVQRV